jgi:hypothetical protein
MSAKASGIAILAIGVVVVGAAVNAMGSGHVQMGPGASVSAHPMIGVYVTLVGGVLLGVGGLTSLLRARG